MVHDHQLLGSGEDIILVIVHTVYLPCATSENIVINRWEGKSYIKVWWVHCNQFVLCPREPVRKVWTLPYPSFVDSLPEFRGCLYPPKPFKTNYQYDFLYSSHIYSIIHLTKLVEHLQSLGLCKTEQGRKFGRERCEKSLICTRVSKIQFSPSRNSWLTYKTNTPKQTKIRRKITWCIIKWSVGKKPSRKEVASSA